METKLYENGATEKTMERVVDTTPHLTFNDVQIKPQYSKIRSRSNCDLTTKITKNREMSAPFIASPMDTVCEEEMAVEMWRHGGLGIIHRFDEIEVQANRVRRVVDEIMASDVDSDPNISAAIGATGDYLDRAKALIDAGVNILLIDVAHGHHQFVHNALTELKMKWPEIDVIAGSIATAEAAEALISWGADALRTGIGGGSMCETRIRSGVGVPQITALIEVVSVADEYDIPVIADGGIKAPGDLCKAIAVGADTGMVGSVFSGTKETPGAIERSGMWPNERLYKKYRGSASYESKSARGEETRNIEGNSRIVEYKGKVKRIIKGLREGLQSSMSYVGASNIDQFHSKARLVRVTSAGHIEGTPHGM